MWGIEVAAGHSFGSTYDGHHDSAKNEYDRAHHDRWPPAVPASVR